MSSSERTGNKYRILPELFSRDLEREREFGISDLRIYGYEAYGDALVTSLILPELFFNGFPFVFEIYYGGARRPAHIRIIPEEEY